MERANELHQFLLERLSALAEMEPALGRVTIDLSRASDVDACGCQLLALFAEHLKRRGITPATTAEAAVRERIDLLGFSELLTVQPTGAEPAGGNAGSII